MKKIKRNNFDTSSTGINIEATCFYDTDLSRMYFQENFESVQSDGYRTTSIQYYIDCGNVEGKDSVKFLVEGTREAREKYFLDNGRYYEAEEVKQWNDETLNEEILSAEEDVNLINYAMDRLPNIEGIEFKPNKNLIVLTTRGYSQGDYAKVIYCPEDLEKSWGKMPEEKIIQESIDHYFWDAPIFAEFVINGKEYRYDEMPEYDSYEWKPKEFIAWVSKESGLIPEDLENFMPDYPEYN